MAMAYQVEGRLLEVCSCNTLCPCWVGEDPDHGTCDAILAWHIDRGRVGGVDVSGRTLALLVRIPGNVLKGSWRAAVYLDERATREQEEAILQVFTGKLGGAVADLAQLIGEVVSVERVPITFEVEGGKGRVRIGNVAEAELEPFTGATGQPSALHDTIFTTIPGSPAYVGKAQKFTADVPGLGLKASLNGHSAVQGTFRFAA
jgi:hypothetical protein